jgi:membrane-associated phospholipid phosphatase
MLRGIRSSVQKRWAKFGLLSAEMIVVTISFFAATIAFVTVAKEVFWDQKKDFDHDAFEAIKPMISPGMTSVMQFFTFFAKHDFLIPANLCLIAYFLFIKKHKWYSIKIPAIALSSTALLFLMKSYFNRNRPDPPLIEAAKGLSFPSGHAMMSFAFYGLLIYITHKLVKNKPVKIAVIIFLFLFIHIIGFSRIYLRVHYASDVIAGFSVGFMWLYFSLWLLNKIERKTKKELAPADPLKETI